MTAKLQIALTVLVIAAATVPRSEPLQIGHRPTVQRVQLAPLALPSPNGEHVAVIENGELSVGAFPGERLQSIVARRGKEWVRSVAWSRDNARLAYAWCGTQPWGDHGVGRGGRGMAFPADAQTQPVRCGVRFVNRDGTAERSILPPGDFGRPRRAYLPINVLDVSPDGRYLLVHFVTEADRIGQRAQATLSLVSASDGATRHLTTDTAGELFLLRYRPGVAGYSGAAFSPDGSHVAYGLGVSASGEGNIRLLSVETGDERPLLPHAPDVRDTFMGWTPDGGSVLFARQRETSTDLWRVPIAHGRLDGVPMLVERDIGEIDVAAAAPSWTRTLFYARGVRETRDVAAVALDARTGRVVSPPALVAQTNFGANTRPRWSPDGRQLAYRSGASHWYLADTIAVASIDTGAVRDVPIERRDLDLWHFSWAPGGRSILVSGEGARGRPTPTFVVDAATGAAQPPLFEDAGGYRQWLPDGKTLLLLSDAALVVRDMSTGAVRTVYAPAGRNRVGGWALSPDGRSVVVGVISSETGRSILAVVDLGGGEPRSVIELPALDGTRSDVNPLAADRCTWSADGKSLLYVHYPAGTPDVELWRVAVATGLPEKLGVLTTDANYMIHRLSLSPDGRTLAFEVIHRTPGSTWALGNVLSKGATR